LLPHRCTPTAIQRDQDPDLLLVFAVLIEKRRGGEHAGEQETSIDGRQFTQTGSASGGHVEKMIVEPLVPRCIRLRSLYAGRKESQRRQRALDRVGARHPAARHAHWIDGERETHGGDARGRARLRSVSHETIHGIGLVEEVLEGVML
jgi:hypothetical protein